MTAADPHDYPRLALGPAADGEETVWLESHSGDTQPQPWIRRCDLLRLGSGRGPVMWARLTAGLPCSLDAYVAATARIGGGGA